MRKIKANLKLISILLAVSLITPVVFIDCFSEPPPDPVLVFIPNPATPAECLNNLLYVFENYTNPDIALNEYSDTLHDDYFFYFDPNDPESLPDSWSKTTDVPATNNMFNSIEVYDIIFTCKDENNGDFNVNEDDLGWNGTDDNFNITLVIEFILYTAPDEGFGADGDCAFYFVRESGVFYIHRWYDHTYGN